jgi:hypothetical protein
MIVYTIQAQHEPSVRVKTNNKNIVRFEFFTAAEYTNPNRTSQEAHYVSATEPNGLIFKICGDYEECRILRCDAGWLL